MGAGDGVGPLIEVGEALLTADRGAVSAAVRRGRRIEGDGPEAFAPGDGGDDGADGNRPELIVECVDVEPDGGGRSYRLHVARRSVVEGVPVVYRPVTDDGPAATVLVDDRTVAELERTAATTRLRGVGDRRYGFRRRERQV